MRAYGALLHLLPKSFRLEYGEEMSAVFEARRRESRGLPAEVGLWTGACLDVGLTALRVHCDQLRQDLEFALRSFRRAPGFTVTAVLVTGVGIGATTATVSVTDHVLVRPLPFREPDRLVKLWEDEPEYSRMEASPANYRDWKAASRSFEAMAAFYPLSANVVGAGEPMRLDGTGVSADLIPMLGVTPFLGRSFTASDDAFGAPKTLLLSHRLWRSRFGGDPEAVGRRVTLDDAPATIIGVMPPTFEFPTRETLFWSPLQLGAEHFEDRNDNFLQVIARVRTGVSLEGARADIRVVAAQLERTYPKENAKVGVAVVGLREEVSENARLLLAALAGAGVCVLTIACTNLANLLLARAMVRRKELAVRSALGAGRERLVRQLLTESLILAACGGSVGIVIATTAMPVLGRLVPNVLPIAETPGVDLRLLAIAALSTVVTGVAFGIVPSLRALSSADATGLHEGTRAGVGGRREALRSALVLAEVTVSVALLASSGLLLRALWRLQRVDPGFRTEGVMTLRTWLPFPKYESTTRRQQFYARVTSEVRGLPGVSGAAYVSFLPMAMRGGVWPVTVDGKTLGASEAPRASLRFTTPGFFDALRIPVRVGRDVSDADTSETSFVAVVSESFARRYWPGESPLDRHFEIAFHDRRIVGVVGDVRVRGLERTSEPQVYLPAQQVPDGWLPFYAPKDLVVRSTGPAGLLLPEIRRIVSRADPEQPISDVQTLSRVVDGDTAARSVQAGVLGAFAAIAVLLAGIGVHGLLAFTVSSREQEIGVRMALGARSRDILELVLGEGARLAVGGAALGVALAYAAGRSLEALLAGVGPGDAVSFSAAVMVTALMTLAGSLLPALRAVGVDPMRAMRAE